MKISHSPDQKRLIPIKELLGVVPISRAGLYNCVNRGDIPVVRIGRRMFVRSDFVDRLLLGPAEL